LPGEGGGERGILTAIANRFSKVTEDEGRLWGPSTFNIKRGEREDSCNRLGEKGSTDAECDPFPLDRKKKKVYFGIYDHVKKKRARAKKCLEDSSTTKVKFPPLLGQRRPACGR